MRKATLKDAKKIQKLVNGFAGEGTMLPRSLNEIYDNIRDFWIVEENGEIIACCALHPVWDDMVEVKSLAVDRTYHRKQIGRKLVEACLGEASEIGAARAFALTFVPDFFEKLGFEKGHKEDMPHKIWSECIKCPHFPDCDEVLVVKEI